MNARDANATPNVGREVTTDVKWVEMNDCTRARATANERSGAATREMFHFITARAVERAHAR